MTRELKALFPADLVPELRRRVWAWDPLGIGQRTPDDEYDSFIVSISDALVTGATPIGLTARMKNLIHDEVGSGPPPPPTSKPDPFASDLIAWYRSELRRPSRHWPAVSEDKLGAE